MKNPFYQGGMDIYGTTQWQNNFNAFFKHESQCTNTFLKQKLCLHSLHFTQNMFTLSDSCRVREMCILFLEFA